MEKRTVTKAFKGPRKARGNGGVWVLLVISVLAMGAYAGVATQSMRQDGRVASQTLRQIELVKQSFGKADMAALEAQINAHAPIEGMHWKITEMGREYWSIRIDLTGRRVLCTKVVNGLMASGNKVTVNGYFPADYRREPDQRQSDCYTATTTLEITPPYTAPPVVLYEDPQVVVYTDKRVLDHLLSVPKPKPKPQREKIEPPVPEVDLKTFESKAPAKSRSWNDAGGY